MERPSNEELLAKYGRMAGSFAAPYSRKSFWLRQDIMAEAELALFEAAEKFDWESVEDFYGFSSYLRRVVMRRVRELIAAIGYASSGSSDWALREGSANLHTGAPMEAADWNAEFEWDDASDAESLETIREVAERVLTDRQYEAFARYYFDGICSDTHVAELMGVNRPAVQKLRVRAEERISEELKNMELL